jgi:iron complex transport system substrate-binding protein
MLRFALPLSVVLPALLCAPALAGSIATLKGEVTVPDAPARIVILNPALAGSVYALGLDVFAVVQSTRAPTEEGYSSVWAAPARASGTTVLPWDFEGFNLESILTLQPDLIVAGGQGRPGFLANEVYDQLSAIAPTLFIDTAPTAWQDELTFMASALGREAEAEAVLRSYAERVEAVKAAIDLPPQPSVFVLATQKDADPYFMPETSSTPQIFADVGFVPDPLLERYPDFESASTGDSIKVSLELASEVLSAPSLIFVPFTAGAVSLADYQADPVLSRLPSLAGGHAYEFPDYAYRFDYYGALAVLDDIEARFAR